jgi:type VI secretion system protein ImpM
LWLGDPAASGDEGVVVVGLPVDGAFEALFVGEGE